jgi:hypothetical protein
VVERCKGMETSIYAGSGFKLLSYVRMINQQFAI